MPQIIKRNNIFINSETDIPVKYREAVIRSLDSEREQNHDFSITPGKIGQTVFSEIQLRDAFSDEKALYFGHGTPGGSTVVNSIFQSGLKVKNPKESMGYDSHLRSLTSTAIQLGSGHKDLFDSVSDTLNRWPHKSSENIIILSFPIKYAFTNLEIKSSEDAYEQFYIGNEDIGYMLRPEFVRGAYNSVDHSFSFNENFYGNLSDEKKRELFDELKDSYIEAYAKNVRIAPEKSKREIPLEGSELDRLSVEWYATQLSGLREYNKELSAINDEEERPVEGQEDSNFIELDNEKWS